MLTMDTKAVHHVLTHNMIYVKPEGPRLTLAELLPDGLLVTEGDVHHRQRRAMVAFTLCPLVSERTSFAEPIVWTFADSTTD